MPSSAGMRRDPDITQDELKAVLDRAEDKRKELVRALPEARESVRIMSMLPKAADMYKRRIAEAVDGEPRAVAKARLSCGNKLALRYFPPGRRGAGPAIDSTIWPV